QHCLLVRGKDLLRVRLAAERHDDSERCRQRYLEPYGRWNVTRLARLEEVFVRRTRFTVVPELAEVQLFGHNSVGQFQRHQSFTDGCERGGRSQARNLPANPQPSASWFAVRNPSQIRTAMPADRGKHFLRRVE